jgi:NADH dehydrogenase FAD-containing subunit
MASELACAFPQLPFTLVTSSQGLLHGFTPWQQRYALRRLQSCGVTIVERERCSAMRQDEMPAAEAGGRPLYVTSETNKVLRPHVVLMCTGPKPSNQFLTGSSIVLNERGYISADEGTLQVHTAALSSEPGDHGAHAVANNVFVVGDLRHKPPEQRLASCAHTEGAFVARQLVRLDGGRPLQTYKPRTAAVAVSLGPYDGFFSCGGWTLMVGPLIPVIKCVVARLWMAGWLP